MNEREFKGFVNTDVIDFMEHHQLEEIQVKDSNSVLNVQTTIKETM